MLFTTILLTLAVWLCGGSEMAAICCVAMIPTVRPCCCTLNTCTDCCSSTQPPTVTLSYSGSGLTGCYATGSSTIGAYDLGGTSWVCDWYWDSTQVGFECDFIWNQSLADGGNKDTSVGGTGGIALVRPSGYWKFPVSVQNPQTTTCFYKTAIRVIYTLDGGTNKCNRFFQCYDIINETYGQSDILVSFTSTNEELGAGVKFECAAQPDYTFDDGSGHTVAVDWP